MQAIDQLNIKTKSFKDLLTDEPYQRKDLIILQDPSNVDKFNLSNFYHLKHDLKLIDKGRQSIAPLDTLILTVIHYYRD